MLSVKATFFPMYSELCAAAPVNVMPALNRRNLLPHSNETKSTMTKYPVYSPIPNISKFYVVKSRFRVSFRTGRGSFTDLAHIP